MSINPNLLIAAKLINEKTCRNCVMHQDGYCNRDGIHADKTKAEDSCRWWIGWNRLPVTVPEIIADTVCVILGQLVLS